MAFKATGKTAGQNLAQALRYYFSVGTRTRRDRRDEFGTVRNLHHAMVEAIVDCAQNPGYFGPNLEGALRPGYGAALSHEKHVQGYRADCTLIRHVNELTPWQFAALLGQMTDAGITNTGQGERFFADMARELRAATAA